MSEPQRELRKLIATKHGLNARAARLLVGETIEQLEQSATALVDLLDARREEQENQQPALGLLEQAAIDKAERKRTLVNALGGFTQQRDQQGRYTRPAASFDGGARRSVPPPPQTHEEWLADALADKRADVGARF
jgi:hypothetical protein